MSYADKIDSFSTIAFRKTSLGLIDFNASLV